jgi:NADPH2:quinone reductase
VLVLFGQSSGPVAPFDPQLLAQRGSLFLTRPSLGNHDARPSCRSVPRIFGWIAAGNSGWTEFEFPLEDAGKAHEALTGRKTTGK